MFALPSLQKKLSEIANPSDDNSSNSELKFGARRIAFMKGLSINNKLFSAQNTPDKERKSITDMFMMNVKPTKKVNIQHEESDFFLEQ
jgi:hypothetical protein